MAPWPKSRNIPAIREEEHQGEGGGLADRKRNKKMKIWAPKTMLFFMSPTRTEGEQDSSQESSDFAGTTKRKTNDDQVSNLHNNPSLQLQLHQPPSTSPQEQRGESWGEKPCYEDLQPSSRERVKNGGSVGNADGSCGGGWGGGNKCRLEGGVPMPERYDDQRQRGRSSRGEP